MARSPHAEHRPLGLQTQPRMRAHNIVCLHTMVGSLSGTDAYFKKDGYAGTESHYGVGGFGERVQWQDTAFTADANGNGNGEVISIETADKGAPFAAWGGSDVPAWTPAQIESLAVLVAWESSPEAHASCPASWACHREGIPLVLIPDTKPGRRGVGYHRQGIDGNYPNGRVPGGVVWSSARGKVCPGDRRIAQVPQVIARAIEIRGGAAVVGNPVAPAPAPVVRHAMGWPVLKFGMVGNDVAALQDFLNSHGAGLKRDGSFGPAVKAAVLDFQAGHGLEKDAHVGPGTQAKMKAVGKGSAKPAPVRLKVDGYLGPDSTKALQRALIAAGFSCGKAGVDGNLGPDTVKALQRFLIARGFSVGKAGVDGDLGPATIKALQRYLGTTADGVISRPSQAVTRLQERLNEGSVK